ncbi:LysR family transcriptional regulator [Kaistia dalseonensis]|uniref:Molybdate transport system regulatory protein n=1 Tax=Kaistia dalseonensis TaxID=410840 RepID=A0ABU0H5X7_9HYPH|nr:LysR family transcriptional regulator [Kaistia dalseonensis]MCX5495127.1 LysR family transcriptional regulator [Kaistia dalseonensis]MDQ0437709.1 molybdate transport system regulatory protein [Kaistia dalseonensis]
MRVPNQTEGLRFRIVLKPGFAFGPGKADLLEAIVATGSLVAAGTKLGMSGKRVWTLVREMNQAFRAPLVETEKGGSGGGGSARLTETGRQVLARYRAMEAEANAAIASGLAELHGYLATGPASADEA